MSAAGYLLRRERLRARMSQAELARRCGTKQSAICRLERGRVDPAVGTLRRYLEACGADLALEALRVDDGE